jgi:hypothetical protein
MDELMGLDWDEIATEYSTLDALPPDDAEDDLIAARVAQIDRTARTQGLHACDRCYMPKYGGKPCQWCQMYAAHPNTYYPTRPE